LLRRASVAQQRAAQLASLVQTARVEVEDAYAQARQAQVTRAIAEMPVERLREVADGRARSASLAEHGYATVADVLRAGIEQLQALPGVGEGTAKRIVAAAEHLAATTDETLQFRIVLDPTNVENTRLLRALAVWAAVRHAADRHGEHAGDLAQQLATDVPLIHQATGLRRLFASPRRRREADAALGRVSTALHAARASGLLQAAEDVQTVRAPSDDQVWRDFERQSAAYYGLLGEVVPLGGDVAAAEGYLPAEIVERVNAQRLDTSKLKDSLRLRGYQSFGARFALVQRRVILGDEMGLGKTVQAIAAMAHLATNGGKPLFLVVCPASVLINWTREIAAHSTLPVTTLHGPDRVREAARWRRRGGVAVTTFGSLGTLTRTPPKPALLVVDEAHYVKNPAAKRTRAVRKLATGAERVLFLSGTPMENRIEEFQSLVGQLRPDLAPAMGREHGVPGVRAFRRAAAPVYLRRNQADVLTELPELVQVDEWVRFGPEDGAAYRAAVREGNFMAMRRAGFVSPRSAKLVRLVELAEEAMDNGRKVVVFSYFRDVLGVVTAALGERAYGPITGETPTAARQQLVDEFTRSPRPAVLVSQIEAGGVGLNIQAASVVILCEPQVKPSIEAQAIARAHRMGQVRSVQVHRLLTQDSVDQRMLEMLDAKQQTFDAYVRQSEIAQAAPGAVDVAEVQLARTIVAREQHRLATEPPDDEPSDA